jgi:transcriptional regulator with XRE-family HTH domain
MARPGYTVDQVRVAQARVSSNLSQGEAADALNVNRVTLNKIENGRANVSLDLLERMSVLYGCSREWLQGEPEKLDEVELGRERFSNALATMAEGMEQLIAALDPLLRLADRAAEETPSSTDERELV